MEKFVIQGGNPLSGAIEVRGAKNAAFPLLAATILTPQDCVIENLPRIEDVFRMIEILSSMGAEIEWLSERKIRVNTKRLAPDTMDKDAVLRFRGSVLLLGALLGRFGVASIPQPGGDIIGARPIDTHVDAFSQLGVKTRRTAEGAEMRVSSIKSSRETILDEFSVTGTENVMLFAARQPGCTTIRLADQDYQVQELMCVLEKMGASVELVGPHAYAVKGKKNLRGFKHFLMYDPIEAGTFIVLGAASKGNITVKNVETRFLQLFLKHMRSFGVRLDITKGRNGTEDVKIVSVKNLKMDRIQSMIYPGLSSDLQSVLGVLATQAEGSTLLHDPLYEGRLKYLEEVNKMGAEIYFTDPHRAIINGPSKLVGTDLGTFDLRGGAAVVIAALIAKGQSTISNIYQIDRGYERIEERLQALGADIQRVRA